MIYKPDFMEECYHCGATPCVVVEGHIVPETHLCGVCFFHDRLMVDYEEWNNEPEDTE